MYKYRCFGIYLTSNLRLPYLIEAEFIRADCTLVFHGITTLNTLPTQASQIAPSCWQWKTSRGEVAIRFVDPLNQEKCEYVLQANGSRIDMYWTEEVIVEDVARVCTSVIIGRALNLAGKLLLHANVVRLADQCIAFTGVSGAGKSSATAALISAGWPLLSDDLASIVKDGERYYVAHGFPELRLWKDSTNVLLPRNADIRTVYQRTAVVGEKQYWDLRAQSQLFAAADLPLRAVFILGDRTDSEFVCKALSPTAAFKLMSDKLYTGQPPNISALHARFQALTQLLSAVPFFLLHLPQGLERLTELPAFLRHYLALPDIFEQ